MLVDDDKEHLKLFTMILEKPGYSLDTYSDPAPLIGLLLDYRMPKLNGLDLLTQISLELKYNADRSQNRVLILNLWQLKLVTD